MFSMPCSIVNNIKIRKMKNDRLKASEKKSGDPGGSPSFH